MKTNLPIQKNQLCKSISLTLSLLFNCALPIIVSAQVESDSTEVEPYFSGDTVAIYTSGLDSIYVTYAEAIPDSIMETLWVINDPYKQMIVELTHQHLPVNQGVYGINLSDFFGENKANYDNNINYSAIPDPWQAVADLAPKTLRIFSGAAAKFMHPTRPAYDPVNMVTYGGYGYDWTEMISYFDMTDDLIDAPTYLSGEYNLPAIKIQLDGGCDALPGDCNWLIDGVIPRMLEFYGKSIAQPTFDPTDTDFDELEEQPMYINQFIDLVDFIETENPGHEVEVIYCVNIESMSATEMLEVIEYLLDNEINLVGVELGNEIYNQFSNLAMGFTDFDHYWKYINGDDYTDTDEQEALEFALADDVENDHDFINTIRSHSSIQIFSIKIGLPAMNTPNCGRSYDFPLFAPEETEYDTANAMMFSTPILTDPDPEYEDLDCDCFYPDWNADMVDHYDDKLVNPTRYLFDAIIFHPYYNTSNSSNSCDENSNWRDIMLQLHPDFDPDHLSDAPITSGYQYDDGAWDYVDDTYSLPLTDERLEKTYFELAGIHYPDAGDDLVPGNFKEFTRDRIDISFEEHAAQMLFTDDDEGPDSKEVWLTEYNLNDDVKLPSGSYATSNAKQFSNFTGSASNTFAHAAMLQNWFLWNVKVNYNNFYTSNFLTRATLQNSLGGSNTMLSTNSDTTDQVLLNEITDCESITEYPYFVRRATYFAVQLWRPIIDNDLDYLKTTTTMASLNNNLAPSVFVDDNPLDPKIYIYYTNVTNKKQWFGIDPGSIVEIFEDPLLYEAILFPPTVSSKIFVADQLYSTAGKNPLFAINDAYNLCEDAVLAENRFELTTTENYFPMVNCPTAFAAGAPNGLCVEMPPVSMGYIVIPIHFNELRTRELNSEFSIFPNPADNYFFVKQVEESDTPKTSEIKIYNLFGSLIKYVISEESYTYIDISDLSAGVYTIEVTTEGRPAQTETLIKIQ